MLASVLAAGHAEAKLKVEALEELLAKVMPLDHPEVIDRRVSHGELHSAYRQREGDLERVRGSKKPLRDKKIT